MLTHEDKKNIIENILQTVQGISNKEFQERIWIRGEGPEVDDFDETCCNFFPESDSIIENYKDFGINEAQYQIFKKFHEEFGNFSRRNNFPKQFIDTPEWAKIMDLAKEVLKAFNYKKE